MMCWTFSIAWPSSTLTFSTYSVPKETGLCELYQWASLPSGFWLGSVNGRHWLKWEYGRRMRLGYFCFPIFLSTGSIFGCFLIFKNGTLKSGRSDWLQAYRLIFWVGHFIGEISVSLFLGGGRAGQILREWLTNFLSEWKGLAISI